MYYNIGHAKKSKFWDVFHRLVATRIDVAIEPEMSTMIK